MMLLFKLKALEKNDISFWVFSSWTPNLWMFCRSFCYNCLQMMKEPLFLLRMLWADAEFTADNNILNLCSFPQRMRNCWDYTLFYWRKEQKYFHCCSLFSCASWLLCSEIHPFCYAQNNNQNAPTFQFIISFQFRGCCINSINVNRMSFGHTGLSMRTWIDSYSTEAEKIIRLQKRKCAYFQSQLMLSIDFLKLTFKIWLR